MHRTPNGNGRVNNIESHPQGEIRGPTKLVNSTEEVWKFAAGQKFSEQQALRIRLEKKAREFVQKGVELYAQP